MEMTAERDYRIPVPTYMYEGARHGRQGVQEALGGTGPGVLRRLDEEHSMAAAAFLAHVMFTVQIAQGLHPKSAVDFVRDEDRGGELARGFLLAGTIEICCDYCAQQMAISMAAGVAHLLTSLHFGQAAGQWEALWLALTGPPS